MHKALKKIALSLAIIILCIIIIVGLIITALNSDHYFYKITNYFLTSHHITLKKSRDIVLNPLFFSFDEIDINYQGNEISLKNGRLDSSLLSKNTGINNLSVEMVEIKPKNTINKNDPVTINDYLPSVLFNKYSGLNIQTDTVIINDEKLKKEGITFKNISLLNKKEKLVLNFDINSIKEKKIININAEISKDNYFSLQSKINNENIVKIKIDSQSDIESTVLKSQIALNIPLHNSYLVPKFFESHETIHGNMNVKLENKIENNTKLNIKNLIESTNHVSIESNGNLGVNNEYIKSLAWKINANINLSHTKEKSNSNSKGFTLYELLNKHILKANIEQYEVSLLPNSEHTFFKESDYFYTFNQSPITLSINKGSKIFFKYGEISANNFSVNWKNKDKSIVLDLANIEGSYSDDEKITVSSQYSFDGYWNKIFSSKHKGSIAIIKKSSRIHINQFADDKNIPATLYTHFHINKNALYADYKINIKDFSQNSKKINQIISHWNNDIRILDGEVSLIGDINTSLISENAKLHHNSLLSFDNVSINYGDYLVKGVNFQAPFTGEDLIVTNNENFPVKIDKFDMGLAIHKISLKVKSDLNLNSHSTINFSELRGNIFKGTLYSKVFVLNLPLSNDNQQPYNSYIPITLKDISLTSILNEIDQPEIQGKGKLFGEIPLIINQDSFQIKQGWLENKESGTIQYQPSPSSIKSLKDNPQMELLFDVLGHLNYKRLETKIELNESGTLFIDGSLQGVNPDYKEGYPIIFNPKITLDFNDMMHSINLNNNIGEAISKRVEEKFSH